VDRSDRGISLVLESIQPVTNFGFELFCDYSIECDNQHISAMYSQAIGMKDSLYATN
jgi:hypothetical protein